MTEVPACEIRLIHFIEFQLIRVSGSLVLKDFCFPMVSNTVKSKLASNLGGKMVWREYSTELPWKKSCAPFTDKQRFTGLTICRIAARQTTTILYYFLHRPIFPPSLSFFPSPFSLPFNFHSLFYFLFFPFLFSFPFPFQFPLQQRWHTSSHLNDLLSFNFSHWFLSHVSKAFILFKLMVTWEIAKRFQFIAGTDTRSLYSSSLAF